MIELTDDDYLILARLTGLPRAVFPNRPVERIITSSPLNLAVVEHRRELALDTANVSSQVNR